MKTKTFSWIDNPSIKSFQKIFSGAIHLLCIEDRKDLCSILCENIFASPLISAKSVHSFDEAKSAISSSRHHHIWLLDLTLDKHNDGIELLYMKNNFPYCIVLTGSCSVADATLSMQAGAYGCYDKTNLFTKTINIFLQNVSDLAALSFSLKATRPSDWKGFSLLLNNFIQTPEEWTNYYFKTFRSVWNFCKMNSGFTPKQFLCIFHAIRFVLLSDCIFKDLPDYDAMTEALANRLDFYLESIDYVLKNSEKIYTSLFL